MPGMPIRRKMASDIEAAGGVEIAVFDRLINGETLNSISKTFGVCRSTLWRYMKKDPDRYAAYEQAQRDGAAGMVDKGQALLQDAAEHAKVAANSAHVQAVRNQAQYIQWQAGVTDRKRYGQDKSTQVQVSIEHLHLGALQAQGSPETQAIPIGEATVIDSEPSKGIAAPIDTTVPRVEPESQSAIKPANQTENGG